MSADQKEYLEEGRPQKAKIQPLPLEIPCFF